MGIQQPAHLQTVLAHMGQQRLQRPGTERVGVRVVIQHGIDHRCLQRRRVMHHIAERVTVRVEEAGDVQ